MSDRPLRIALVTPGWPAEHYPNGIVTYVKLMRDALLAQGHVVHVLAHEVRPGNDDGHVHRIASTRWQRLFDSMRARFGRPLSFERRGAQQIANAVRRIHDAQGLDVVELEETFGMHGFVQQTSPVPVIVKLHGPAFLTLFHEDQLRSPGRERVAKEAEALKHAAFVSAPSRCTLDQTIERHGLAPAATAVLPNPMVLPADAPQWSLSAADPKHLIFVGRFDRLKGGDTALLAFQRLLTEVPDLRLTFVGPDHGLDQPDGTCLTFEAFCAAHLTDAERSRVTFLGQQPRDRVFALRVQARVTLVLSRWENQPNTALEAMAQGCPLVALDTGGVGELVVHGESGLLAQDGDIEGLCLAVLAILRDDALAQRLGAAGRAYVERRHAPTAAVAETVAFYRKVVDLSRIGSARQ